MDRYLYAASSTSTTVFSGCMSLFAFIRLHYSHTLIHSRKCFHRCPANPCPRYRKQPHAAALFGCGQRCHKTRQTEPTTNTSTILLMGGSIKIECSRVHGAAKFHFTPACPKGRAPAPAFLKEAACVAPGRKLKRNAIGKRRGNGAQQQNVP